MLTLTNDATTATRDLISSAPLPEGGGLRIATTHHDKTQAVSTSPR